MQQNSNTLCLGFRYRMSSFVGTEKNEIFLVLPKKNPKKIEYIFFQVLLFLWVYHFAFIINFFTITFFNFKESYNFYFSWDTLMRARQTRRDAIFSFAAMFKKCTQFVYWFAWKLGCLEAMENYVIEQKFRAMAMKGYRVSMYRNYTLFGGYNHFIYFKLQ